MKQALRELLTGYRPVRWVVGVMLLCRGALFMIADNEYRAMSDFCRVVRVSDAAPLRQLAQGIVLRSVRRIAKAGRNSLVDSYRSNRASAACASLYSISGRGPHDLFRDVIVLKKAAPGEKGVMLLKYARTFDAMASLFDLARLMERYVFVLEPCWAGYCDPSILMFMAPGQPVFVQCFTEEDHEFISAVGPPLVPVRLGPADWVDSEAFAPVDGALKTYDIVMVANWGLHKRHATLFRALAQIRDRDLRVLLVGFPWAGRTAEDIRREADSVRNHRVRVDVVEQLSHPELARHLSQCKVFVFLSKKEGDNKALVEAMFADVPAIVYENSIGGARSRINPATGILTSDEDLARNIVYMLDHLADFTPRAWALEHTGSAVATKTLDAVVARTVTEAGFTYSGPLLEKVNAPNLTYKEPNHGAAFDCDLRFILACLRGSKRRAA